MRDLNKLHPWVKGKAQELIKLCKANGVEIIVTQTLRTKAEQDALYAQGRTKPGKKVTNARYPQSLHCWGIAFDIVPIIGGKAMWGRTDLFDKVGLLGESIGLTWGGRWKNPVDRPHFQAPNHDWRELTAKHGDPARYIGSWKR